MSAIAATFAELAVTITPTAEAVRFEVRPRPPWLHAMCKVDTLGWLKLPGEAPQVVGVSGPPVAGAPAFLTVEHPPLDVEVLLHVLAHLGEGGPVAEAFCPPEPLGAKLREIGETIAALEARVALPGAARFLRSTTHHLLGQAVAQDLAHRFVGHLAGGSDTAQSLLVQRAGEIIDLGRLLLQHLAPTPAAS